MSAFANAFHPLSPLVLARYRACPLPLRFYTWFRWCVSPYAEVVAVLPSAGLVIDMGCGLGLLAGAARIAHPDLDVLGVDMDARRIQYARRSAAGDARLEFRSGSWFALQEQDVAAFVFVDVLHHLTVEMQLEVLQFCAGRLRPGGLILLKDVDTTPRWKYAANWLFDRATALTDITRGAAFNYRSAAEWAAIGAGLGLAARQIRLEHQDYAPHILLRLEKPA